MLWLLAPVPSHTQAHNLHSMPPSSAENYPGSGGKNGRAGHVLVGQAYYQSVKNIHKG